MPSSPYRSNCHQRKALSHERSAHGGKTSYSLPLRLRSGWVTSKLAKWVKSTLALTEEWEVLLHRLVRRGAKAENGLKAIIRDGCGGLGRAVELVYAQSVIDQRCIFHKLKNVRDKCRTELKGDDHREQRRQLLQDASAVYQAESAEQAKERLAVWSTKWGEVAHESVTTFERDAGCHNCILPTGRASPAMGAKHFLIRASQSSTATQIPSGSGLWLPCWG